MNTDEWIVLSNIFLVLVTLAGGAIGAAGVWVSFREGHRHEEQAAQSAEREEKRLAEIVHEVLTQEHENDTK